jgi:two-component system LytT family response regulator
LTEAQRILIVDDELLSRQRLTRYLHQFDQPLVIEEADSGLKAVEAIRAFHPDIVLLDVEMPGLSGFEVLQQFDERPFHIIFQTAYDEFAIRAFEEQACDYLLKPFTAERLHQALRHALSRVADEARLKALEAMIAARDGHLRLLSVKQGGRLRIVEEQDICCFVSRDHYTCVYFNDAREGITDLSLNHLIERLDPRVFRQLHRNNVVRASALVALATEREVMEVELTNGMRLPVSRSHRRAARDLLKALGR